jgi:hypothetical protein
MSLFISFLKIVCLSSVWHLSPIPLLVRIIASLAIAVYGSVQVRNYVKEKQEITIIGVLILLLVFYHCFFIYKPKFAREKIPWLTIYVVSVLGIILL